jgi:hypothetical protein
LTEDKAVLDFLVRVSATVSHGPGSGEEAQQLRAAKKIATTTKKVVDGFQEAS